MRFIRQVLLIAGFLLLTVGGAGINAGCQFEPSTIQPISLAVVSGRVTHILTGVPLAGVVTITANGVPPVEVAIGQNGMYTRGALPTGPARIQARATGFADYSANVTLNNGDNTHNIQLVPNP